MRRHLSALVVFLAGCTFTLALLTRCSVPIANAGGTADAGTSGTDGGSISADRSVTRSGSRLKARVLNSDDGARILVGWHDSQLDVDCAPRTMGAEQRCMPLRTINSDFFFRDSMCTQRMVRCDEGDPLAYVVVYPTNDVFHLGAQLSGTGRYWVLNDKNECVGGEPSDFTEFCEVGEDVSRDTFALLTPGVVE